MNTTQATMVTYQGTGIECSTVVIGSTSVVEACSEVVESLTYISTPKTPLRLFVPLEKPSPQETDLWQTEDLEQQFNEGYDSDNKWGPYWDATRIEGDQLAEEGDDDNNNANDDDGLREITVDKQSTCWQI